MQKIIVLNPKGGSGKTTIASNLAACFAASGQRPALMDLDPQGSSMRWLRKRPEEVPGIHGIAGYERTPAVTRSWQLRVPADCHALVIDSPAAVEAHALPELTRGVDAVLVPVRPSEIDIHAAAGCIAELLLACKVHRSEKRLVIVANRARRSTRAYDSLMRFLQSLRIPVAAVLRDSQAYVRTAECGMGLHEMKGSLLKDDLESWQPLVDWLERRSSSLVRWTTGRPSTCRRPSRRRLTSIRPWEPSHPTGGATPVRPRRCGSRLRPPR